MDTRRQELISALTQDIMTELTDDNLGLISDALVFYLDSWTLDELTNEYRERATQ